jgi:DNA oxidative demethylase
MHGVVARRTARRYGFGYDYNRRSVVPGGVEPLPAWLLSLRERCGAALTGTTGEEFAQALVQRYLPGAPIGWHRDSPSYGLIAGVSLLAAARLRFRRGSGTSRDYPRDAARTTLRLSALGTGALGLGTSHPTSNEPSLLDHAALT